jgi:D-3-phosphoglycerate dehydrogenase
MPKVLISDALSPAAVQIFKDRGIEVDFQPNLGKDKEKLAELIGDFDGLAIRSATKVSPKILEKAKNLKVIGRAGIGVDNVDIPAATARGIIVMNTPFGNSITTAEHAITLMLALARQIPQADASTQAGKWEKNRFMGVEITAKTLGIIGCGNIGSIVADRALGLRMKVIAFDPFLSPERAVDLGVEKVELDELFKRSDFITLHTPLTDKTRNIIDAKAIAKMKPSVRIINCARGGLVDEVALRAALDANKVAGAAFDVFVTEPATENVLFGHPNVVSTGERRAAGRRADVGLSVARRHFQRRQFPLDQRGRGAQAQAVHCARRKARLLRRPVDRKRHQQGADRLRGRGGAHEHARADVGGARRPAAADARRRQRRVGAGGGQGARHRRRGDDARNGRRLREPDYRDVCDSVTTVTVVTESQTRAVSGTVFADGRPRIVNIKGIRMDAEFGPSMIYITNLDKPGFIGRFSSTLGEAGINIATFHVGREAAGGSAVALIEIDGELPADVLAKVRALPQVQSAKRLHF